jgi:hypothetical protein
MGMRPSSWMYLRRAVRMRRSFAVSSFTIFLLVFGLVYWVLHVFTVTTIIGCEYAIIWLTGWRSFQAVFQWLGVAIGVTTIVWLLRVIMLRGLNRIETAAQFVFILGLVGALLAQKAYLFPYGTPSREQVERVVSIFSPPMRLIEEQDSLVVNPIEGWKYDYPPPPFARAPEHPRWNEKLNLRLDEIFDKKRSSIWPDEIRMWNCFWDYRRGELQYTQDLKIWDEYWDGFDDWYALNSWRYGE